MAEDKKITVLTELAATPAADDVLYIVDVSEPVDDDKDKFIQASNLLLGAAPIAAQYVTLAVDATLTNERVLTGTANQVVVTDAGAGLAVTLSTPQDIHTAATPTFGGLIVGSANGYDVTPGSDIDADLITVNVTGTPRIYWDESQDGFHATKGHHFDGNVGIGIAPNATYQLYAYSGNVTATSGTFQTYRSVVTALNSSASSAVYQGFFTQVKNSGASDADITNRMTGFEADIFAGNTNAGTVVNDLRGFNLTAYNANANSITNAYACFLRYGISGAGSGDITNAYGAYINPFDSGTGTITNLYGLYITDASLGGTLGYAIYTNAGDIALNAGADGTTTVVIGGATPQTNGGFLQIESGWTFKETTAPTADTNYGKMWTNTSDELWFQDGAGANHLLHGDAFSNIWFNSATAAVVTISTEDAFTLVDSFTAIGHEDDAGNVVGNITTDTLTLSANGGGEYEISYHASITTTGASKEVMACVGIVLATAKDITDVTDDTVSPIVITSTAHGFNNGDMVEIVGVLGNTAANGSFIVANKAADTFQIVALDGTATTGNGDFDAGSPTGDVTIWYAGNMVTRRTVSQTNLGAISATGLHVLQNSDVLSLYIANLDDTSNINIYAVSLDGDRIGD